MAAPHVPPAALPRLLFALLLIGVGCLTTPSRAWAQDDGYSTENPEAPPDTTEPDWQPWKGGQGFEWIVGLRAAYYSLGDLESFHRRQGIDAAPNNYPMVSLGFAGEINQGWRMRATLLIGVSQTLPGRGSVSASHRHIGGHLDFFKRINPQDRWPFDFYMGFGFEYWNITLHYRAIGPLQGPSIRDMWGVDEPDALTNRTQYVGFAPQLMIALRRFPAAINVGYSFNQAVNGPRNEWGDRINVTEDDPNGEPEFVAPASIGPPKQLGMFFVAVTFRLHIAD